MLLNDLSSHFKYDVVKLRGVFFSEQRHRFTLQNAIFSAVTWGLYAALPSATAAASAFFLMGFCIVTREGTCKCANALGHHKFFGYLAAIFFPKNLAISLKVKIGTIIIQGQKFDFLCWWSVSLSPEIAFRGTRVTKLHLQKNEQLKNYLAALLKNK